MDNEIDVTISKIVRLSREQFAQLLERLTDNQLAYLLKSMKSYRERYPYPLCKIVHFN